jgi:hypothetical protein
MVATGLPVLTHHHVLKPKIAQAIGVPIIREREVH